MTVGLGKALSLYVFVLVFLLVPRSLCAQDEPDKSAMGGGISLSTNALEWLLTVPNVQVGFDLSSGEYNNKSIHLGAKYNWDTWHKLPPFYVFNVLDFRGEYRYHYRHVQLNPGEPFKFFSLPRRNPRPWLAHYVGGYTDWSSFSLKPGKTGRQGWQAGVGATAGIEFPLYEYGSGAVDMDLGVSAGLCIANFFKYGLNESATVYVVENEKAKWMVVPVITELRAAFTWRKASVRTKYVKTDPEIPVYKQAISDIESDFRTTTKADFDDYQKSIGRLSEIQKVDTTYRGEFIRWIKITEDDLLQRDVEMLPVNDARKAKLRKFVLSLGKKAIRDFDAAISEEKNKALKESREAERAAREAERAAQEAVRTAEKAEKSEEGMKNTAMELMKSATRMEEEK